MNFSILILRMETAVTNMTLSIKSTRYTYGVTAACNWKSLGPGWAVLIHAPEMRVFCWTWTKGFLSATVRS